MPVNRANQPDTSTDEKMRLAELLKQAREYLSLSQDEVAKAVGIPRAAISLVESGQRRVDALELKKFAAVYQRPVSYFTGDEVAEGILPAEVEHLARAAANLSSKDREELARFAEFLQSRSTVEQKTK
jgi:transcriptional regulator with XRE-family HTH domain